MALECHLGRAGISLVHPQCLAHEVLVTEHTFSRRRSPPGSSGPISAVNLPVPSAGLRASRPASGWFCLHREHPHFTHHLDSASTFCRVGSIQYLPKICIHRSILFPCIHFKVRVSLVAQTVKTLPETQETGLIPELGRSPGGGHGNLPWAEFLTLAGTLPMAAIHSSILAWRIPWREEPAGLQSTG